VNAVRTAPRDAGLSFTIYAEQFGVGPEAGRQAPHELQEAEPG
jgi:hypothetical protein